jgi:excisionase family DNA binding protein
MLFEAEQGTAKVSRFLTPDLSLHICLSQDNTLEGLSMLKKTVHKKLVEETTPNPIITEKDRILWNRLGSKEPLTIRDLADILTVGKSNGIKELLTTRELAEILKVGKSTLEQDRLYGRLCIPYLRLGRSIRYRWSDVEAYLQGLKSFTSTSDIGK